jgi:cell wall-associated NlpC family hydrolase
MPPSQPTPARHARRSRRLLRSTTVGAIAIAVAVVGSLSVGASPAAAEIAGDRHSPAVVMTATAALQQYDEFAIARMSASRYDQSAAYRAGHDFREFARARDRAAVVTAGELGVDPKTLRKAWRAADVAHQVAVLAAVAQIGTEYSYSSSEPGVAFDCSGLTAYAWGRAGVALYPQSGSQIDAAAPRDQATARAGDLVQYPGHVMMYLGVENAIVHAANHDSDVELSRLRDGRSFRWGDPSA